VKRVNVSMKRCIILLVDGICHYSRHIFILLTIFCIIVFSIKMATAKVCAQSTYPTCHILATGHQCLSFVQRNCRYFLHVGTARPAIGH